MYFIQESSEICSPQKLTGLEPGKENLQRTYYCFMFYVLSYSIHVDPASLGIYLVHGQLQSFQLLPFPTFLVVSQLQHVYFVELVKAERS